VGVPGLNANNIDTQRYQNFHPDQCVGLTKLLVYDYKFKGVTPDNLVMNATMHSKRAKIIVNEEWTKGDYGKLRLYWYWKFYRNSVADDL
jgi:hypothetical protein